MALTVDQINDLEQYKALSTHITGVLNAQAAINSGLQLLTTDNILLLNDAYELLMTNINTILTPAP